MPHAGAVDGVAGLKVVRAVEHHVGAAHLEIERRAFEAPVQCFDLDLRVQPLQRLAPRLHLRLSDRGRGVQYLALKIGEIHAIAVGKRHRADARGRQVHGRRRAEPACADHQSARLEQSFLGLDAELCQQQMPGIAQQLVVGHSPAP